MEPSAFDVIFILTKLFFLLNFFWGIKYLLYWKIQLSSRLFPTWSNQCSKYIDKTNRQWLISCILLPRLYLNQLYFYLITLVVCSYLNLYFYLRSHWNIQKDTLIFFSFLLYCRIVEACLVWTFYPICNSSTDDILKSWIHLGLSIRLFSK